MVSHRIKLAGRTFAINIAYVGEHVLNIGPSTAHNAISHHTPFFFEPPICAFVVALSIPVLCIIHCRACGKRRTRPKRIKMKAENFVISLGNIPNLSANTFIIRVKKSIEIAKEAMIIAGFDFFHHFADPPMMTGRSGSTHGASTVSIPATNDSQRSHIVLIFIKR